jgi:hypothetical protein
MLTSQRVSLSTLLLLPFFPVQLGNWNEDIARQEVAAKDYEVRRAGGELLYLRKRRELNFLSQAVPHSFHADGLVRFGDSVMLATAPAGGAEPRFLCSNIFSPTGPGASRVTAGAAAQPTARNVHVLARPPSSSAAASSSSAAAASPRDDVLRFGDRLVLACNPSLVADLATGALGLQHVLHSQMGSNVLGTTRGGKQEVCMRTRQDAEAEWVVLHASGDRLMTDGEPVKAGDEVVLVHKMSNVFLCGSPAHTYPTEFGSELDVHCQTHKGTGVKSAKASGDVASSRAEAVNRWRFVLSDSAAAAVDERGFTPLTGEALLARARALVAGTVGMHGLRSLALSFAALDAKGTGSVPREAAKFALVEHGVTFGADEFGMMLAPFDRPNGLVASAPLLAAVRGADSFGAARAEAVGAAWGHLQSQARAAGKAAVSIGLAKASFDAKWDPRVCVAPKPQLTAPEALLEFQRQWPLHKASADELTEAQFFAYYRDVSACVPSGGGTFESMVLNTWHVPGRGHWKLPKAMKVLVTLHKGSSTEATIPDGENLDPENFEQLCEALEKRCRIGGVARVKVLGFVDVS